jgi:hypothetical protein
MDKELEEIFDVQKTSYTNGFESGWNACLDDIMAQLKTTGNPKKIVFQYYGMKEISK